MSAVSATKPKNFLPFAIHQVSVQAGSVNGPGALEFLTVSARAAGCPHWCVRDQQKWVSLLAEASVVQDPRLPQPKVDSEQRCDQLVEAMGVLMGVGVNPLSAPAALLDSHVRFLSGVVALLAKRADSPKELRLPDGGNPVHLLTSAEEPSVWGALEECPEHWWVGARPQDGKTPLHLVWGDPQGLVSQALCAIDRNDGDSWRAHHLMDSALAHTQALLSRGAQWSTPDALGQTPANLLVAARRRVNSPLDWLPFWTDTDWFAKEEAIALQSVLASTLGEASKTPLKAVPVRF